MWRRRLTCGGIRRLHDPSLATPGNLDKTWWARPSTARFAHLHLDRVVTAPKFPWHHYAPMNCVIISDELVVDVPGYGGGGWSCEGAKACCGASREGAKGACGAG